MESKIKTSYKYASDSELLSGIHRILGKIEGNSNFPDPPAAFEQLKNELPGFITALTMPVVATRKKRPSKGPKKPLSLHW